MNALLRPIRQFLHCETPSAWIHAARQPENLPLLLIDHLICELKAAQSAMLLIRRYAVDAESGDALLAWLQPYEDFAYRKQGDWRDLAKHTKLTKTMLPQRHTPYSQELIDNMVLLIKEELHHFYQVLEIMDELGVPYTTITSSRYARGLLRQVRTYEPATLVDKLICGAYIEARSCERFAALAPYMEPRLAKFYESLLRSEARHFEDYLRLAEQVAGACIRPRIREFGLIEASLILAPDTEFRFHSGPLPIVGAPLTDLELPA